MLWRFWVAINFYETNEFGVKSPLITSSGVDFRDLIVAIYDLADRFLTVSSKA